MSSLHALLLYTAPTDAHHRRSSFQIVPTAATVAHRRARTATTLQTTSKIPQALLGSLTSLAFVELRTSLFPLPDPRPLVVFVQLDNHNPPDLSTTPSALCFPPMTTPTPSAINYAVAPLRRVARELHSTNGQHKDLAVVVYSSLPHVPEQLSDAAMRSGAHALLTPPFTPQAVETAMHSALERQLAEMKHAPPLLEVSPLTPITASINAPFDVPPPPAPSPTLLPKYDSDYRRRSVDIGELASGQRPLDLDQYRLQDTTFADLISDMCLQTQVLVEMPVTLVPKSTPCVCRLPPKRRKKLVQCLQTWNFQPRHLPEDDELPCTELIFEALLRIEGLEEEVGISLAQLCPFFHHLRQIYRAQNKFHNFIHALDVLQALYTFLTKLKLVPPISILWSGRERIVKKCKGDKSKRSEGHGKLMWKRNESDVAEVAAVLRNKDIFTLCLAAIGHDVAHPGNSNAFMNNAKTPLSILFDKTSVLERMHCTILLKLLKKYGMYHLVEREPVMRVGPPSTAAAPPSRPPSEAVIMSRPSTASTTSSFSSPTSFFSKSPSVSSDPTSVSSRSATMPSPGGMRKLLVGSILATDMGWHFDWIVKFSSLKAGVPRDMAEEDHRLLICQALMKCADISNPARPHAVAQHWAEVLVDEWAIQALLEEALGLPISVAANRDDTSKAQGQVGFIGAWTQPLFEVVASVLPDLADFAKGCATNKMLWQARVETLQSLPPNSQKTVPIEVPSLPPMAQYVQTVFPLSLPPSLLPPPTGEPSSLFSTTQSSFKENSVTHLQNPTSGRSFFGIKSSFKTAYLSNSRWKTGNPNHQTSHSWDQKKMSGIFGK